MIRKDRSPHRLSVALASVLALQTAQLAAISPARAQAADANAAIAAADKAAKSKDWAAALAQYDAANKAAPSADALEGLANARYQLKQDAEAWAAYDEYLKTYGAKVPKPKKAAAEARLKELEGRTGALTVASPEAGAQVFVDDKAIGTTPLAGPVRLAAGPHRIRLAKDGFGPVDQVTNVQTGAAASLEVKLEALSTKGRLSVREKAGKPIRVLVDGVDLGDAPWSGEVSVGQHDVSGRGTAFSAAPEKVTVERAKTHEVELVASSVVAPLKITTPEGKGLVYLDGKLVGEGSFSADVPAGTHHIKVTREGYDPFEQEVVLVEKQPSLVAAELKIAGKIETLAVKAEERELAGIYGGFGLLGTVMPGGTGSSIQRDCERTPRAPNLVRCSGESGNLGAGLNGFLGYHWDPVGVELFLGAHYDQTKIARTWGDPGLGGGIGVDPARDESFTIRRIGGYAAFRMRLTLQSKKIRFTVPVGVGLSYRSMLLERRVTSAKDASIKSGYLPDAQSYIAPVLSIDPGVHFRLSDGLSVGAGLSVLLETPNAIGKIPTTPLDPGQRLGAEGLQTNPYELARDAQIYVGPYIGMMFGP
jgi:hypothetical protein